MISNLPIKYLGAVVGVLKPDKTFLTIRKEHHYFKNFQGFGISYNVLMKLKHYGCKRIVIIFKKNNGTAEKYDSTPDIFLNDGLIYKHENDFQRVLSTLQLNQKKMEEYLANGELRTDGKV